MLPAPTLNPTHIFSNFPAIQPPSAFWLSPSQSPWELPMSPEGTQTPIHHPPPKQCPPPPLYEATCGCPLTPNRSLSSTMLSLGLPNTQKNVKLAGSSRP